MAKSKIKEKVIIAIQNSEKPLTAQNIHKLVEDADLATVYRNINKLLKNGEITELRIKKGESLYEINKDNHQHSVCKICGKIEHINIDTKDLINKLEIEGFVVENIEITIKGRCKKALQTC